MLDLLHHRPLVTDIPALPVGDLAERLRAFSRRDKSYREEFLQSRYAIAFDGYSYPGQNDSLNQGPEDLLHSFVFSDFSPVHSYPGELQSWCRQQWPAVTAMVQDLEQSILGELGLHEIARQHREHFGHMMSANYYPPASIGADGPRLGEHPDVSLLTVFPFGMPPEFQYQDPHGNWVDAQPGNCVVVFAGDLLNWLSDGAAPALNHRVRHGSRSGQERFSFALFSLPAPGQQLLSDSGRRISTEAYYAEHLSQWEY